MTNLNRANGRDFWLALSDEETFQSASVSSFPHAPYAKEFRDHVKQGMITLVGFWGRRKKRVYWFAKIVRLHGYLAKFRWLGVVDDSSHDFWKNLAHSIPTPAHELFQSLNAESTLLEAPHFIKEKLPDWEKLSAEALKYCETYSVEYLENDFDLRDVLAPDSTVQAVDITSLSALRPARPSANSGRRVMFRYLDDQENQETCWLHLDSGMLAPSVLFNVNFLETGLPSPSSFFEIGAKLELIDPSRPAYISVGTIKRTLAPRHLLISIDGTDGQVYLPCDSPALLPAGFAFEHELQKHLKLPAPNFSYDSTKTVPLDLFPQLMPDTSFRVGQALEVVGTFGTNLIYPGRIVMIAGHLLLVSFLDRHGVHEYLFFPMTSTDIYPVGWCDLHKHRLQTSSFSRRTHGKELK